MHLFYDEYVFNFCIQILLWFYFWDIMWKISISLNCNEDNYLKSLK